MFKSAFWARFFVAPYGEKSAAEIIILRWKNAFTRRAKRGKRRPVRLSPSRKRARVSIGEFWIIRNSCTANIGRSRSGDIIRRPNVMKIIILGRNIDRALSSDTDIEVSERIVRIMYGHSKILLRQHTCRI